MARGKWDIDNYTGLSKRKLGYADGIDINDVEGSLKEMFPRANISNVRSMAAIVGVTPAYFADIMLNHPDKIFHTEALLLFDGHRRVGEIRATHVNSLQAGMEMWNALDWGTRGR